MLRLGTKCRLLSQLSVDAISAPHCAASLHSRSFNAVNLPLGPSASGRPHSAFDHAAAKKSIIGYAHVMGRNAPGIQSFQRHYATLSNDHHGGRDYKATQKYTYPIYDADRNQVSNLAAYQVPLLGQNNTKDGIKSSPKSGNWSEDKFDANEDYKTRTLQTLPLDRRVYDRLKAAKAVASSKPTSSSRSSERMLSLSVCTYNLSCDPINVGESRLEVRVNAICDMIANQPNLDLIGLQEVDDEAAAVMFPRFVSMGYTVHRQPDTPRGVAIVIKSSYTAMDFGWRPYTYSKNIHGFLYAHIALPSSNHHLLFVTTNLPRTTGLSCESSRLAAIDRRFQLDQLITFLRREWYIRYNLETLVVAGHLGWADGNELARDPALLDFINNPAWQDSFLKVRQGGDPGYTYDGIANGLLNSKVRGRFDRCLVQGCEVEAVRLMGTEAIPGRYIDIRDPETGQYNTVPLVASTHYGLVTDLLIDRFEYKRASLFVKIMKWMIGVAGTLFLLLSASWYVAQTKSSNP
jgi:hypothetical protein